MKTALAALVVLTALAVLSGSAAVPDATPWSRLDHPIDRGQLTALPFGVRSHYLQPWRGYLDTPPSSRLRSALGINFNVWPAEANATARVLGRAGFGRARLEAGWATMDPGHPSRMSSTARRALEHALRALARRRIRPLILLNANSGNPAAARFFTVHVLAPAAAGSRTLVLAPGDMAQLAAARSGLNSLSGPFKAAAYLFAHIQGQQVTLSRPLASALPPGTYGAATLAYEPFGFLAPGADPASSRRFAATLAGWRDYVRAVTRRARHVLGGDRFDVEVWNELTFGSDFLNINNYYDPPIDPTGSRSGASRPVIDALTRATIRQIRRDGMRRVGISDGFASQVPWPSGATEPAGITAISKHYYRDAISFPAQALINGVRPVDESGRPSGTPAGQGGNTRWTDTFIPSYRAYFPEYFLSAIQTETLVRDLAPIRSDVYGVPHGRTTHPHRARPPEVWMTEYNLTPLPGMTPAQVERLRAKVVLRYLTAFVNKGLGMVTFYAAKGDTLGLVDPAFLAAARSGRHPPSPGLALTALGRLTRAAGPPHRFRRHALRLTTVATPDPGVQFAGNGSYPPLRNLDVAAFLPFQRDARSYLIAAYVMTRDLGLARQGDPASPRRFDMPPSPYRFTVTGLGCRPRLSALDPLSGRGRPVRRIGCARGRMTFEASLTDWPVLIRAQVGR
jgi:hypothetical protein